MSWGYSDGRIRVNNKVYKNIEYLPNTTGYGPGMVYSNKLIRSGGDVEVWLLLIHKECVWHPYILYELWPHRQGFNPRPFAKG